MGGPQRRVWCLLAALAVVAGACAGEDEASGRSGGAAEPRDGVAGTVERTPDPGNCPLDALERADGPVDVTLWHGLVGVPAAALEAFAEEYNASQERVRVTVHSQGDYEELLAKFTAAVQAGDDAGLPDIVLAQDSDTQYMVDSDAVVAADDCIAADPDAQEHYETLADFVRSTFTVDGLLWPAAFGVASPILYYNRSHLQQAGLDPDDAPGDLEELREVAEAIKAVRPEGAPIAFRADSWWIENLSTRQEHALVDHDNGRAGLAARSELRNDTVVGVVEWMEEMVDDGLMTVFASTQVTEAPLAVIRPGADNSSMLIDTSSAITTLDALLGGAIDGDEIGVQGVDGLGSIDLGVAPLPGPRSAGSGQIAGNAWYVVDGADPARIAATWDFLRWVTQTPQQVRWTTQGSYLPVWQGAIDDPELHRYFTETRAGRWLEVARRGLDTIDPEFPGPLIGPYSELRQATRSALEGILLDGRPVDGELARADSSFQAALDDYARDVDGG